MVESERLSLFTILVAEDDPDDQFLMAEAFREIGGDAELHFVEDGVELMCYLRRSGKYADATLFPLPLLILLDLNMPKKDGRQALREIKLDPDLQAIPVVIWTTSHNREDKIQCKKIGADLYITKPSGYAELVNNMKKIVMKFSPERNMATDS